MMCWKRQWIFSWPKWYQCYQWSYWLNCQFWWLFYCPFVELILVGQSPSLFFIKVYAFWSWKILIIFQAHGLCLKPNFQPALNHRGLLVSGLVWPTSGLSHLSGQGRELVLINTKVEDITSEVVRPLLSGHGRVRTLGSITTWGEHYSTTPRCSSSSGWLSFGPCW